MGTSVGLWCVEHTVGYWESGVRHDEAMAWVWRNRQLRRPRPEWQPTPDDPNPTERRWRRG